MNKIYFLLLIVLLAACNEGNFPSQVSNHITPKHINIPGTRVFVVAPAGFTVAGGFMGLRKSSAVLQVYDNAEGNFFSNIQLYGRDKFEREGDQIAEYKDVLIDGYKGKFIFMKSNTSKSVYTLVFGDSTFCTTMLGVYTDDDEATGKELKAILESVAYDTTRHVDPFARAPFTINDSMSAFKFAKLTGSAYIYTTTGQEVKFNDDVPYVIISSVNYGADVPLAALADTTFRRIEDEHAMTSKDIKNASATTMNNYPAYEREIYGVVNGKLTLLYELAMVKDKSMIIFTGHSKNDFAKNIADFRNLAQTISIK